MADDFLIDLVVPNGFESLVPLLGQAPFEITVEEKEGNPFGVLVQSTVSEVAGFWFAGSSGQVHHYECSVRRSNPGPPEAVLLSLSSLFQQAGLSHRMFRIVHELDENEELVSYVASA
jgi:hypothetical protein